MNEEAFSRRSTAGGENPNAVLGRRFYAALVARDWTALRGTLADDASWTLPGDNAISGRIDGADAIVTHVRRIAAFGVNFELRAVLESRDHVALSLHNTARRGPLVLDEQLATVLRVRDGRIAEIETFLSDVPGMNAFFVCSSTDEPARPLEHDGEVTRT